MNHDHYCDEYLIQILSEARRFALVGASMKKSRDSSMVFEYLLSKGYDMIPVNPGHAGKTMFGQTVHGSLFDIAGAVDVVDIFRNSRAAFQVTEQAIGIGAKVVWMQLGVRNDEAARMAEDAGLRVVMNRCPKIEYARLEAELKSPAV